MPSQAPVETSGAAGVPSGSRRVADVMRRDFITISREESVLEALQLMRLARLRHLPVVSEGVLVGVLSYRDLQDELVGRLELPSPASPIGAIGRIGVQERMRGTPFSIVQDATLAEAAARLERLHVGCLPVVDPGDRGLLLVGLLTEMDLLRAAFSI
jgi:CBS domain-containing protein